MTIVELPDYNEGYLHLEVDGLMVAMLWINANKTNIRPMEDGRWILNIDSCKGFLFADAIRRK